MNRIPGILLIVMLITLLIRYLPRFWKGANRFFGRICFPVYVFGILYLTIFSRLISFREIYNRIFNMEYDPSETAVVGERGSEWIAGKQGVSGLRLIWIGLSDPNSVLYIIPSCLMNLLLFLPLGMLFRYTKISATGGRTDRFWISGCAVCVLILECVQLTTGLGQFDPLDLLFNTIGFGLGLKIYDRFLAGGDRNE